MIRGKKAGNVCLVLAVLAGTVLCAAVFVAIWGGHAEEAGDGKMVTGIDEDIAVASGNEEQADTVPVTGGTIIWSQDAGLNASGADSGDPGHVPIEVPEDWRFARCSTTSMGQVWTYEVSTGLEQNARSVLDSLQSIGATLYESGYLDLHGNAWGCAAELDGASSSVMVTMIPQLSDVSGSLLEARVVMLDAEDVYEHAMRTQ